MNNENLTILLPKSWYLLVFIGICGYFVGSSKLTLLDEQTSGFLVGIFSIGVMWGGLVVGYWVAKNKKK